VSDMDQSLEVTVHKLYQSVNMWTDPDTRSASCKWVGVEDFAGNLTIEDLQGLYRSMRASEVGWCVIYLHMALYNYIPVCLL